MAAPKRPTHEVTHKKLYMAVEGEIQHVKAGTQLVLSEKQAKSLGKKVAPLGEKETVDLTGQEVDFKKLNVEELKAELDKKDIKYPDDSKKADLLKLLETSA